MALSPRKSGQAAVRSRHSTFTRHVTNKLAPFFPVTEVSGGPLLIATLGALLWVNLPMLHQSYEAVWQTELGIRVGEAELSRTFAEWTQDALLPLFFFGVGIEVKREMLKGLLSSRKTATLPVLCALGGMAAPAAIYLAFNASGEYGHGWGATVTTDTAFALALVGMFETRLPRAVRVLLLAFAAVDDIGGLLVIAFVYTAHVSWGLLAAALGAYLLIIVLRRLQIISSVPYVLLGLAVCLLVQQSGIHTTIAGVMLGALVPVQARVPEDRFAEVVQKQVDSFKRAHESAEDSQDDGVRKRAYNKREMYLGRLSETTHATFEPAQRITQMINPWISYLVLPLFALSNAGVQFNSAVLKQLGSNPVGAGIIAGLVIGKPLGMLLLAWLGVRLGIAKMPQGLNWRMMVAIGISSGIGFTLSLFVSELAFHGGKVSEEGKLAVLIASVMAAAAGYLAFRYAAGTQDRQHGDGDGGDGSEAQQSRAAPRAARQEAPNGGALDDESAAGGAASSEVQEKHAPHDDGSEQARKSADAGHQAAQAPATRLARDGRET